MFDMSSSIVVTPFISDSFRMPCRTTEVAYVTLENDFMFRYVTNLRLHKVVFFMRLCFYLQFPKPGSFRIQE